jgi:hypothetical protein
MIKTNLKWRHIAKLGLISFFERFYKRKLVPKMEKLNEVY